MNAPPAPCPVPESAAPVTVGATRSAAAPSTRKSGSSAIAKPARESAGALFPESRIQPPASESAEAPTEAPFASASPRATV